MSFYNTVFGVNPLAPVLLAALDLDLPTGKIPRFRDIVLSEGTIAVYTRTGGKNRRCWCMEGEASPDCPHHIVQVSRPVSEDIATGGDDLRIQMFTGAMHLVDERRCNAPQSIRCRCNGCVMQFHVPKYRHYMRDQDDGFDNTYATIYFAFPPEHAAFLRSMDIGPRFDPDARWREAIARIKAAP